MLSALCIIWHRCSYRRRDGQRTTLLTNCLYCLLPLAACFRLALFSLYVFVLFYCCGVFFFLTAWHRVFCRLRYFFLFPADALRQVLKWMYEGGAATFDDMNNIPKALRAKLSKVATVGVLEVRFYTYISSPLLFGSTRRIFYPKRSSGQVVVTGVSPSPPRCVASFWSRIGFSIPTIVQLFMLFDLHRIPKTRALALLA